jgi:hypothetical protein
MKKNILKGLATLGLVVLLASCDKVPQPEIDAAKASVEEARVAGADVYLPGELTAVEDSLNSVVTAIEAKKSKWFVKFDAERAALTGISTMAVEVKANTEKRIAELTLEINTAIEEAKALIEADKELVAKAPKGKGGAAVLEEIKNDINVLDGAVAEAASLLASGKLIDAKAKVDAVKTQATDIKTELEEAIAKVAGKKK